MEKKTAETIDRALLNAQATDAQSAQAASSETETSPEAEAEPVPQPVVISYEGRRLDDAEIYRAAYDALAAVSNVMSDHRIMDNEDGTFTVTLRHLMQMCIEATVNAMSALPEPDQDVLGAMSRQVRNVRCALAPFGFARFAHSDDARFDDAYTIRFA